MGIGSIINKVCDLVLPDSVGDVVGCVADAFTGNIAGAVSNGCDAVEDIFDAFDCEEGSAVFSLLSDASALAGGSGMEDTLASGIVGVFDPAAAADPTLGGLLGDIASFAGAGDDVTNGLREAGSALGV